MIDLLSVNPLEKSVMEDVGMSWHTDSDGSDYISHDLVQVSEKEAEAYYEAANVLYDMFVEAGQYVIDNRLYYEMGIASNLVAMIEKSWDRDDLHLYGRFDLAGGLDGRPVKLIEFNADTPTSLFEISVIQWALLKSNQMDEAAQFNNVHEMLQNNFKRLVTGENSPETFSSAYQGQKILFSCARDLPEDESTVRYLQSVAHDAGWFTDFCYMDEVGFDKEVGVFNKDSQLADFWFKLFPWEDIATDEIELTRMLEKIVLGDQTRILNPAYTLLFQSKGILKILYDLFPESPYLLPAAFEPPAQGAYVQKKLFGREGANMSIIGESGDVLQSTEGPYDYHKDVYQEYVELVQDRQGNSYQAGVFFAWEACGLGFRRGGKILDDMSKFVGHIIV